MTQFLTNSFGKEPFFSLVGPVKDRGPASGIITRHGYIVAEWGDPNRADITNSVTKTFLTTVVGLAVQRGLIKDVNDYARDYMPPHVDLFDAPHNQKIKWDHLLRQTSDWQGTLWGKPDWADRPVGATLEEQENRKLWEPGTHFKYNDVRVNVMALAALQVWRRPLPDVLREEVMEPIGASSTWRWYGYENSWVDLDGQKVQSVSGGGHWGGGMFINSYDMARFGYLFLRNGKWKDRSIVSEKWIQMARTPGPDNKTYGYANWYLNTDRKPLPSAPETAVRFVGNGSNIIYIDWENDIVAVFRWIRNDKALDQVVGKTDGVAEDDRRRRRRRGRVDVLAEAGRGGPGFLFGSFDKYIFLIRYSCPCRSSPTRPNSRRSCPPAHAGARGDARTPVRHEPGAAARYLAPEAELPPARARAGGVSRARRAATAARVCRAPAAGHLPRLRRQSGDARCARRRSGADARSLLERVPDSRRDLADARRLAASGTRRSGRSETRHVHDGVRNPVCVSRRVSRVRRRPGVGRAPR